METSVEKENLSIDVPDVFDQLKGEDASFEMVISNTVKPLRLFYNDNVVTDKKAVIFVYSGIDRLPEFDQQQFEEDCRNVFDREAGAFA